MMTASPLYTVAGKLAGWKLGSCVAAVSPANTCRILKVAFVVAHYLV